ncbi:glycosyltransferase family 92 protein [Oleidesulfovibrio sp.]|uniref:glycosyltransferase family 92 protein n=1 Tax=Oleidesulfovibrio sp. TaxID=2909707 RepID=UPI003A89D029
MQSYYAGICAIVKDEDPFLEEWIFYHHLLGFEHFILFDNQSAIPLTRSLKRFVKNGLVTVHEIAGKSMQLPAYRQCLQQHGHQFKWLAFFDLDEFLVLKEHKDVRLFLDEYRDHAAVAVHWVPFGSGGYISRPQGLVTERYFETLNSPVERMHVKCITQPRYTDGTRDPHCFSYVAGLYCVDENQNPVMNALAPFTVRKAQLNHYHFKSQQDYEEKKAKGRADNVNLSHSRKLEDFYAQSRAHTEKDYAAMRQSPHVRSAMNDSALPDLTKITQQRVNDMELFEIIDSVQQRLAKGDVHCALMYLLLAETRFADIPTLLHAFILAYLAAGNTHRAEQYARKLISIQPATTSYYLLFLVQVKKADREAASSLGKYIRHASTIFPSPNQPENNEMLRELKRQDEALGLGIWELE